MKPTLLPLLAAIAVTGVVHADVPRKAPLIKYQRLWRDSPFTAKPVTGGPVYNPLENYVLLGVSPIADGYRVTLLNKKKPTDPRIVVETRKPAEGFRILDVVHQQGDPLATVVRMASGGQTGLVAFDEKFLKLKPAAETRPAVNANRPTVKTPPKSVPGRTKKPRIVVPKPPVPKPPGQ